MITALLAGIVTFSACKKDDPDPAAEGVKAANEMCGCVETAVKALKALTASSPESAFIKIMEDLEKCGEALESKYAKYEDNKAFNDAAEKQGEKCKAAEELQELFEGE